ncbi:hypothetical protein [Moraxella nasicaprae]|uniref:Uncharacterized protein n=1 Tax=Moraxella nasicaprae TaxID=2904122 RepID=A0ABY6F5X5_9GAMM|nr:hypothetical protein [Moraxella nasicaprae]UXZ05285.1 hypothetical protein LU297_02200 [Moraxella nasicaprae]
MMKKVFISTMSLLVFNIGVAQAKPETVQIADTESANVTKQQDESDVSKSQSVLQSNNEAEVRSTGQARYHAQRNAADAP